MLKWNYGQGVIVLPQKVLDLCAGAGAAEMKVLLLLASDPALADAEKKLAGLAGLPVREVRAALKYWIAGGILTDAGADGAAVPAMASAGAPAGSPKVLRRAQELPDYTSVELAELLEKRSELRMLIDEAQQLVGKIFNQREVNILVGMTDTLGLDGDCLLTLLAHCGQNGVTNLRAIEKLAISLVDEHEIRDAKEMEAELQRLDALHSFEGELRTLLGIRNRSLTTREKTIMKNWVSLGYTDIEIIRRAYEMTVNATNEPSMPYMNAILEKWNSESLRTPEEIDGYLAAEKEKRPKKGAKNAKDGGTGSFDTDDFFEAALKRSFH